MFGTFGLQALKQIGRRQFLYQSDRNSVTPPIIRGPRHRYHVRNDRAQLHHGRYIDRSGWPLRFYSWLIRGNGILQFYHSLVSGIEHAIHTYGQRTRLVVHFDDDVRRKEIVLFAGGFQEAKPQLDLLDVVALDTGSNVARAGDVGGLLRRQVEIERRLLHPLVALGHEGRRFQQVRDDIEERKSAELDIRMYGEVVGRHVALLRFLLGVLRVGVVHALVVH
jgi:hypothetical protein